MQVHALERRPLVSDDRCPITAQVAAGTVNENVQSRSQHRPRPGNAIGGGKVGGDKPSPRVPLLGNSLKFAPITPDQPDEHAFPSSARAIARPIPPPAPVTAALRISLADVGPPAPAKISTNSSLSSNGDSVCANVGS